MTGVAGIGENCRARNVRGINKAIIKHRKFNVFKSVNNSRLVWDPEVNPKDF